MSTHEQQNNDMQPGATPATSASVPQEPVLASAAETARGAASAPDSDDGYDFAGSHSVSGTEAARDASSASDGYDFDAVPGSSQASGFVPLGSPVPAPAPGKMPQPVPQQKPGKRRVIIVALVLLLLAALVAAAAFFLNRPDTSGPQADPNVRVGTITGSTADLDKIVDEGMLTFSINSTPTFANGTSPGNLMIENADINNNRFTVAITRDDTGETIYESGALDPGQYINDVPLDVALPAGEYVCTATFSTFSLTDNKPIGQAAAGLTVHVLE